MELADIVKEKQVEQIKSGEKYNPQYRKAEDYLSSMRCQCACNPGGPGPYCNQPPKCSQKISS